MCCDLLLEPICRPNMLYDLPRSLHSKQFLTAHVQTYRSSLLGKYNKRHIVHVTFLTKIYMSKLRIRVNYRLLLISLAIVTRNRNVLMHKIHLVFITVKLNSRTIRMDYS